MATSTLMQKLSLATASAAFVALGAVGSAQAATFTEFGDAGQTLGTAQTVGGGIDVIQGNISSGTDADLFSFYWGGGLFSATTVGGASFDTMLQLFNSSGTLLAQNDDSQGTLQSTLSQILNSGNYLLGVSSFPNFAGDGPTYDIYGYGGGYSSGDYSVKLDTETASVPEPASVLGLLALGAMGAGSLKRKQQKNATEKA